ncbi:nitrous oxide reductase family maturation protein NosD [Thalassotalea piscium]|uniref:Nitrous oxidase accessory protein n=1 Tax=Thalassotalea piscium TaxID=1230533 RepID=A0A7X0NFU0_9GAMM|nr:nitrous oxide reductase family maturation protein NosD [Thalassotalea piscium]MBB6542682.1 nitrous oxidase accessory protein [Thalassotalea piscium]
MFFLKKIRLIPLISIVVISLYVQSSAAKIWQATPAQNLQQLLNDAENGDTINLSAGRYLGNFVITKELTITSSENAIIDAQGKGHALLLRNSHITVENLTIVNWGDNLTDQDSGIYSDRQANHIILRNNKLKGDGFGIWLQKGQDIKVLANTVEGNTALRSADRGNGIQLSVVKNVEVKDNEIFNTRDGIYIISSQENSLENNTMHDLRYGIHYMYSHDNQVINNHAYNTRAGYALMSSKRLIVKGNTTHNSEDYGFLLNFITTSTISNNVIKDVWTKSNNKVLGRDGKGLFVYNSAYNTISNNVVDTTEIGIHLTAGSENTQVYGNSFLNNPTQVKYVSNKKQEWSHNSKGNYWSNYVGWDMDNDGIGDVVFEPNDGIDKLVWQYPEMKMLMDSPAVLILRWVQRQFPVLKPPGVKDSFPLMKSPHQNTERLVTSINTLHEQSSDNVTEKGKK